MLTVPFYHSLLRKYVVIFGTLFNNIKIERKDSSGNVINSLRVPIAYGPREKYLSRVEENPTGTPIVSTILPRMAFEMTGLEYAADRKLQTTHRIVSKNNVDGNSVIRKVYVPVPYDISFTLYIMVKSTEDGTRIVEQILPYFTPEWTVSAKLLADFDNLSDIPLIITSLNIEDNYEGSYTERRALIYSINFLMKGYLYGPSTKSKVIKFAETNLYPNTGIDAVISRVTVQPGMDANGNPTTNISETIPYFDIDEDDNWDYIVTETDYNNE